MSVLVVKLGSSIVARDTGEIREDVLGALCDGVAAAHESGTGVVIVSSGAIAHGMGRLGHSPASAQRPGAIDELQAASAVGQGGVYRAYDRLLGARGITSAQVLLTVPDMSARAQYLNARATLRRLLEWRVVPVINENDTTATDEISFGNNDFLAAQVAILLDADRLVLLTDADGVHDADPARDPRARRVPVIEDPGALSGIELTDTTSPLGTGGMRSKVLAAEMATGAGVGTVIASGLAPDTLPRVLAGEAERGALGTWLPARAGRSSAFKLWLRHAKPARGRVEVDAGAVRALREAGTSLLPVGIIAVSGSFRAGDAVEIVHGPEHVGKGISSYSAEELQGIRGLQTDAVRDRLPHACTEAIHRDHLVLT